MFNDYSLLKLAKQRQAELLRDGGTPGYLTQERRKQGRGPARLIRALLARLRGAQAVGDRRPTPKEEPPYDPSTPGGGHFAGCASPPRAQPGLPRPRGYADRPWRQFENTRPRIQFETHTGARNEIHDARFSG